ncbi:MAG: 1-acyl-sn-glycerol-3-phosphate acyltransferase [Spirochaetia bacterium]|nr:1-acyl-sn-glycerol-3-phosphate acyltransferase [Spirochaetia bacterium]NCC89352.1 1-acyl-sn-glycerol-3-phosphate acyltransferase [Spirochaetia bacterium]
MSKKPLFIRLAQPTYGAYLLRHHHIQAVGMEQLSHLAPPFLVMGNHVHTFDPFFVSAASPIHIRWVAGAYLFKMRGLRPLMERWIQAISKQQGRSDLYTIRTISEALKQGDVVGLFPEGTRSWDGEPVGFDMAIAKLVKIFKVPIVLLNLEGLYGLRPRWARKRRKGTGTIRVVEILSAEDLGKLSVEELYDHLTKVLGHSNREYQKENPSTYQGNRLAEGLEQLLYLCPDCHHVSTLSSKANTITCTSCSYEATLDAFDQLHIHKGEHVFADVAAWHAWEKKIITSEQGTDLVYPEDQGVLFQKGEERRLRTLSKHFTLHMEAEGFTLKTKEGQTYQFAFPDIGSMIINAKNTVELFHNQQLYRIRIQQRGSILKYVERYQARQKGESV